MDYGLRNHILQVQTKMQKIFVRRNAGKLSSNEDGDPFVSIRNELENSDSNGDGDRDRDRENDGDGEQQPTQQFYGCSSD